MVYDVIIIGGGITGAGILRDCAQRGLKALLLEKTEPGRATTGASTHLIHGGLRYLLYDRLTTHTTSWDAGNIVRIAAPLVRRLPVFWPIYRDHQRGIEIVETLLKAYDPFQVMKCGRKHLRLDAEATSRLLPDLRTDGLLGAVSFDEWWVDAVGLVEKNLESAKVKGGEVRTRTRVTGLLRTEGGAVTGVKTGAGEIHAKVVVNASGPWVNTVSRMAGIETPLRLRKGTHLVYDRPLVPFGMLLEAIDGERYIFVIPFPGGTLVGPTDLDAVADADSLHADESEIRYLLDSVRRYLPDFPQDYTSTRTGARPILGQAGAEKLLSREYEIRDHADENVEGFLTVAGGKMSDFRLMGKDAVDLVCRKLNRNAACTSHRVTLDNVPVTDIPEFPRPWPPLKRFLRRHPRLRELYSLAWLGAGLLAHMTDRLRHGPRNATVEIFRAHYDLKD